MFMSKLQNYKYWCMYRYINNDLVNYLIFIMEYKLLNQTCFTVTNSYNVEGTRVFV